MSKPGRAHGAGMKITRELAGAVFAESPVINKSFLKMN